MCPMEAKEKNKGFYWSEEWRNLRYMALQKYGNRCMACGADAKQSILHVDHIKPISKYPELKLSFENLQILCKECNLGKSNKDQTDWRGDTITCCKNKNPIGLCDHDFDIYDA